MTEERRAIVLMLVFVALWAFVEGMAGRILRSYSPYQVVWTRYGVHLALMLAIWGWREPATLWTTSRPAYQLFRSLLMLGMPAFWIMGMQSGPGGHALMSLFWISPLVILVLARVFLHESPDVGLWLAAAAASAGGIALHGLARIPAPELLVYPAGMALCFCGYVAMTRPLRRETTRANLFYSALGVFLALSPAMPGLFVMPGAFDFAVMAGVGIVGYLCLWALDRACAAAPVSIAAPVTSMHLAFALLLGYLLGHGDVDRRGLAGLLVILAAAAYAWHRTSARGTAPAVSKAA